MLNGGTGICRRLTTHRSHTRRREETLRSCESAYRTDPYGTFHAVHPWDFSLTESVQSGTGQLWGTCLFVLSALTYLWLLGIITDSALGKYATEKALDDSDSDTINALPVTQWHRNVDIPILRAHNEGKFQFTRLCA